MCYSVLQCVTLCCRHTQARLCFPTHIYTHTSHSNSRSLSHTHRTQTRANSRSLSHTHRTQTRALSLSNIHKHTCAWVTSSIYIHDMNHQPYMRPHIQIHIYESRSMYTTAHTDTVYTLYLEVTNYNMWPHVHVSTYILVFYRYLSNYNIKLSNILYHWLLSMASFRFCETYLLHIKPLVVNKSAIFPFWGSFQAHTNTHVHESRAAYIYTIWIINYIHDLTYKYIYTSHEQYTRPHTLTRYKHYILQSRNTICDHTHYKSHQLCACLDLTQHTHTCLLVAPGSISRISSICL